MTVFLRLALAAVTLGVAGVARADLPPTGFDPVKDWPKFAQTFYQFGDGAGRTAVVTRDGAVVDIPAVKRPGHIGWQAPTRLAGPFQMEVKYDLLQLPAKVSDGYGVSIGIKAEGAKEDGGASLNRGVFNDTGLGVPSRYGAGRYQPRPNGEMNWGSRVYPTTARQGRMALRRVGGEVLILAADTPDGELVELTRYPFPEAPVRNVGLHADTGGAVAALKVRFYDVKVLTGAAVPADTPKPGPKGVEKQPILTAAETAPPKTASPTVAAPSGVPGGDPAEPAAAPPAPVRSGWLLPLATFGGGLVIGVFTGRVWAAASR